MLPTPSIIGMPESRQNSEKQKSSVSLMLVTVILLHSSIEGI